MIGFNFSGLTSGEHYSPYFIIHLYLLGDTYVAEEVHTECRAEGPTAVIALERLTLALKINEGGITVTEAEVIQ